MVRDTARPIAAFCHIPKTGGMTFHDLLRRYFGWGHVVVSPARGWFYQPSDLRRDLRLNLGLRSIGGHATRPFVSFGDLDSRLVWYTILRDPLERCISNYQHQVEKMDSGFSFTEWLRRDCNQNWHVNMLAGEQDLEAAKQIMREKIRCFGTIDRYNEFLLLLRHRMGWDGFNVTYSRPRNPSRTNDVRRRIKDNMDEYRDDLVAANELDIALYEYAVKELYPLQIQDYGPERLQADLEREFTAEPTESLGEGVRRWQALFFEKGVYRNLMKLNGRSE